MKKLKITLMTVTTTSMVLLQLTYLHEEAHFIKALFRNVVNLFDSVFSFSRNKLLDLPWDSGAVTNQEYYETVVTESSRYVAFWEMFLRARANVHCFKNSNFGFFIKHSVEYESDFLPKWLPMSTKNKFPEYLCLRLEIYQIVPGNYAQQ